jgi:TatD DNase family protein
MNLIDTHAHLTYSPLSDELDAVLERSRRAGVTRWITIGTTPEDNAKALGLARSVEGLYAGLGYHPHEAQQVTEADLTRLQDMAAAAEVVAVGETGLDYHYMHSDAESQRRIFRAHLAIAAALGKPAVIHTREAFDESLQILDEFAGRLKGVVIHCYGGDEEQTRRVLERGFLVSFTGTVTFKSNDALRRVAAMIPPERIMVETDCPYISPEPMRKVRPNEPSLLVHTAARLADVHGFSLEKFARLVTKTSVDFYALD